MPIIISTNGKKAVRVEKSDFEKEDRMQQYIHENPESIPLCDVKEDTHLLILAREFPTNSGPIDALAVDRFGELYINETKLFRNADKRYVVAQVLDYGAALWKHATNFDDFTSILNSHCQSTFKCRAAERIKQYFSLSDDEVAALLEKVRQNLNDGSFHFVILMDKLDDRLKNLILYVNQNSQFDIYAVELEYYKFETQEIIIPRIFGAEVKKDVSRPSSSSARHAWSETELLADAESTFTSEEFKAFRNIYDFSQQHADEVNFGTGAYGSFSPIFTSICPRSLYTLGTNGRLSFNFDWIDDKQFCEKYADMLEQAGFTIPETITQGGFTKRPSVTAEEWVPRAGEFVEIISSLTKAA